MIAGRTFEAVPVGEELPVLEVPITRTLVVAGAVATRDFTDVHHDPEAARARGATDVFMNILTTNGFVGRFVTDWAGPGAMIRRIAIRLGAPNYPGDTMTMTGRVVARGADDEADGVVEVEVRGTNRLGDHVTGTVEMALPRGGGS